ncbi:MAG: hypothetical protein JNK79_13995, partial [Chitinophagaceae bacterium]|nr:hypothetical protein [Chitinophagaceae bacterium]
ADSLQPGRYNADSVFQIVLPYLNGLKNSNCNTLFECTPNYLGRDVRLLERLSKASGVNIVTNTGYYGAVKHKYLPRQVYTESSEQIAKRWIAEFRNGIDGTDIRPGFIKLSADEGPLSPIQRIVLIAGAITYQQTGLTIAMHSGDGNAAREELSILMQNGVAPDAFIWVHAQNEKNFDVFKEIAGKGAWVEFDGLNDDNVPQYVSFLKFMKENDLLHRTLVSHDAGYYDVVSPKEVKFRRYTTLFTDLLPALKKERFSEQEIEMLTKSNPAMAFSIGK